jgi:hypothetical protein
VAAADIRRCTASTATTEAGASADTAAEPAVAAAAEEAVGTAEAAAGMLAAVAGAAVEEAHTPAVRTEMAGRSSAGVEPVAAAGTAAETAEALVGVEVQRR